jgi:hypothetical protein
MICIPLVFPGTRPRDAKNVDVVVQERVCVRLALNQGYILFTAELGEPIEAGLATRFPAEALVFAS